MSTFGRIKTGVMLANDSYRLLYRHPRLFIYAFIAAGVIVGLPFLIFMYAIYVPSTPLPAATELDIYTILSNIHSLSLQELALYTFGINFFIELIKKWCDVCLSHDAMHTIRNQQHSVGEAFSKGLSKWWPILQWAIISLIVMLFLQLPFMKFYSWNLTVIAGFFVFVLGTLWNILMLLVIPFIATERITITRAITLSGQMVRPKMIETISALLWIAIVNVLAAQLVVVPALILSWFTVEKIVLAYAFITTPLLTALTQAAGVTFRTLAFDQWYNKPLEQALVAEHDLIM